MQIRVIPSTMLALARRDLQRDTSRTVERASYPPIRAKWHPRTTLLFILTSSGLLWAGISAAVSHMR